MNWRECKVEGFVKRTSIDLEMIKSLLESSKNSLESSKLLILKKGTVESKFNLGYDSIRGLLEALALKKGYKIQNHECYVGFLKEICSNEKLSLEFDRFRFLRNQVQYYAKKIPLEEFNILFNDLKKFRKEILKILKND